MSTATTTASPIAKEAEVFNQIKSVINMIFPIINAIPFVPQDLKNQMSDIQTKLNAIPTIEQMMASDA